jgi:branched-chain amino acid aminotransferase
MTDFIPMDQRDGWIWLDGRMVSWRDATLHVLSHGLHYASAVFEGERVYGGSVFRLEDHGERLLRSAAIMDLDCPFDAGALDQAVMAVVEANRTVDGYVRRLAWRGAEQIGVAARQGRTHVAIASWPWAHYFDEDARLAGIRLRTATWRRPPPETAPVRAKASAGYAIGTLAKHQAERAGCDDALMLDHQGRIAEATGANIFFVRDSVLHTPVPDCFLDGLTRQTAIALAKGRGIEVVERKILPDELGQFNACFVTGTAAEITPVREIDGIAYQTDELTQGLMADFTATVHAQRA